MSHRIIVAACVAVLFGNGSLIAQNPLTVDQSVIGRPDKVSFAGDLNGDGVEDFLVALFQVDVGLAGRVSAYSGSDGSLIHQLDGVSLNDRFGASACGIGDINNDGFDDFLIGISGKTGNFPASGEARVYSGLTGLPLYTLSGLEGSSLFGHAVTALGDLDSDGVNDFAIGAPATTLPFFSPVPASGAVYVYSGKLGTLLHTLNIGPTGISNSFGSAVAEAGDVNNDGVSDVIVGAPLASPSQSGLISIFSGSDGSLIRTVPSTVSNLHFGVSLDGIGDVNHDGIDDQIVGGSGESGTFGNLIQGGAIAVLSGLDGSVLHALTGTSAFPSFLNGFGANVSRAGDINGDGFFDFMVSEVAWNNQAGRVQIYSGDDASVIYAQSGEPASYRHFGRALDGGKDVDGDGFPDAIVGALNDPAIPLSVSITQLLLAPTLPVSSFQSETGETNLFLTWHPDGADPTALTGLLSCTEATPAGFGLFGASLAPTDFLLSFGIPLLIANDPTNLLATGAFGFDNLGEFHAPNVSLLNPFLAGTHIYLQFFESAPTIRSSNGLRLLIH